MAAEETWRLTLCARCRRQVRVCPACDRGQRFCELECAKEHRRAAQRAASLAYQAKRRGARLHSARQQRYRDRVRAAEGKFPGPKVTQHLGPQARQPSKTELETQTDAGLVERVEEAQTNAQIMAMQSASDGATDDAAFQRAGLRGD